jgi:hypothetical protein
MGGEREMRATGGGGDCGGAAIVDGEKLAGVSKSRARGLHFQIKGYRGEVEVKASLIECISWPGEDSHGLALNDDEKELVGILE